MRVIFYLIFLLNAITCYSQFDVKEIEKYECVFTAPRTFSVYENPNYTPSYRSIKDEFISAYNEYDARYWTIGNYVYPTALDAYNDTNPYERNVVERLVNFDISNPAIFYLRLDENLLENPRRIIIKYIVNYEISPPIRNNFDVIGCKLDDETNVFNLNKALLDIYSINHYYIFSFYKNYQDAALEQNPIPEFEWENYSVLNEQNSVILKVKYRPDYIVSDCVSTFSLNLIQRDFENYIPERELLFCGVPFEINGPFDRNNVYQFSNFEWYHNNTLVSNDFNVTINEIGEWEVFFDVSSGCRSSIKINVIQEAGEPYIKNVRSTMTQIIIEPSNANTISAYSIDGITWQDSNIFNNSSDLLFTFYIKNMQGCIFGPFTYDVSNFFTFLSPNSDGINDKWDIRSTLKLEENNLILHIFDRNGKILSEGKLNDILPWDGKYNNKILPSGSYWYRIFKDNEEVKSGSIIIKNH